MGDLAGVGHQSRYISGAAAIDRRLSTSALCWRMACSLFLSRSDARLWWRSLSHLTPPGASKYLKHRLPTIQISPTLDAVSLVSLQLVSLQLVSHLILHLSIASVTNVVINSIMRHPPTDRNTIQLPTTSAFNICDGLFKMANCLVVELPDAQLRDVRYALETLVSKVDRLLESGEYDLSLNFDGLAVNPGESPRFYPDIYALTLPSLDIPGAEDFGTPTTSSSSTSEFGMSSISTTANIHGSGLTSLSPSPRHHRQNTVRIPAPTILTPTPAPTPAPTTTPIPRHGSFPFVVSSRKGVGLPNYSHHPLFVQPGRSLTYLHT